jgi:hypothetical protein
MNRKDFESWQNKQNTINEYMAMINQSWTWARLTKEEKDKFVNCLYEDRFITTINGTKKQRWAILNNYYCMFLKGVGYKPIGWRETEDVPQF